MYVPIFVVLLMPFVTHAGILSFISDVFSGQEALAESETVISSSSQTMDLLEAPISPDPLAKSTPEITVVNDEALLPDVSPSNFDAEVIENNGQISVYKVRDGDTFSGIANMFNVSVNTILWANDLNKSSVLKTGQTLVILPMSGVLHVVVSGDTLNTIAKKYGGDIDEIAGFNDLKVNQKLTIGDKVMVPYGQSSYSATAVKSTSGVYSNGTSRLIPGSSSGPDYQGYYQKPFLVGKKTQGLHGYNSVDYGMPIGSPLYAAASGVVIIAKNSGYNGGYGNYVTIQHPNGTQTVYGHMNYVSVSVGQSVTKGESIGSSGNSGKSTGPHLHFEVRGAKNPF